MINRVLDMDPANFRAQVIFDTSAISGEGAIATWKIQGSADAVFTSPIDLGQYTTTVTGRHEMDIATPSGRF